MRDASGKREGKRDKARKRQKQREREGRNYFSTRNGWSSSKFSISVPSNYGQFIGELRTPEIRLYSIIAHLKQICDSI